MAGSPLAQALQRELAKRPRLDPRAVMAVAAQEGLGGGIGDQGTSFGAFQLHQGGAYPSWAPQGQQAAQQWAWSPAGINYALDRIEGVAGGLKGQPAVTNIVSRFERPANIPREIQGALGAYGGPVQGGSSYQTGVSAPAAVSPAQGQPMPPQARAAGPLQQPRVAPARQLPAAVQAAIQILRS